MIHLLEKIIHSRELLAKLLNTLSLLEYIGCRKILKSQMQESITENILTHAAEELRHARLLKKYALKLEPIICASYQPHALFCGIEACQYFQNIDHASCSLLKHTHPYNSYLFTTYLIEMRALSFYQIFEQQIQEHTGKSYFKGILFEENKHLREIASLLKQSSVNHSHLEALRKIEGIEFDYLIERMRQTLCNAKPPTS